MISTTKIIINVLWVITTSPVQESVATVGTFDSLAFSVLFVRYIKASFCHLRNMKCSNYKNRNKFNAFMQTEQSKLSPVKSETCLNLKECMFGFASANEKN
jgi:hypothetical protein